MTDLSTYLKAVIQLLPVFSALSCAVLVLASVRDSISVKERKLKYVAALYLAMPVIVSVCTFCYGYAPASFVFLNVPYLLAFLFVPIFFYRVIRYLTLMGNQEKESFGLLHYIIPGVLGGVLLIWSFFIPFDVQLTIVEGKGEIIPVGYEAYARYFLSKPLLRTATSTVYIVLTIVALYIYFKRMPETENARKKPAFWVIFLVAISLVLVFNALVSVFVPRRSLYTSLWAALSALLVIPQYTLLTWHIIRRKYLLYVDTPKSVEAEQPLEEGAENLSASEERELRHHTGKITRRILEAYFRREKPYLNPDFKITDLVEGLDVNRTMISGFINDTYGVNFNRYLNRWRLAEMRRLMGLPSNRGKSPQRLVTKAGFSNSKHYLRALRAEENDSNNTKDTGNAQ